MDLDFSEEQNMLRETTRAICDQHYGLEAVRDCEENEQGYPPAFWQALVESGLTALTVPEDFGGVGLGLLDAVVVFEELGRTLSTSPLLSSSILAARAIELLGTEQQKSRWLPLIAGGEVVISCAQLEEGGSYDERGVMLDCFDDQLNGSKTLVPYASTATHFLTLARERGSGQIVLALLAADSEGIDARRQANIASSPSYQLTFTDAKVETLFSAGDESWPLWQDAMSFAAVTLSAQASGSAEQMLNTTAEYAKTRVQFGKPIGQFQALSHTMAELAVEVEAGKTLVYQAAWAQGAGCAWQLLAAQAKLHAGETIRRTTKDGLQIHGGIGFTTEADPQLYYRRAKQLQLEHWDAEYLERRIAGLLLDSDSETSIKFAE
jgi:alkylation response protein AidB-like acyl-CoA dehydrogenase